MRDDPAISVVVPSHNRAALLGQLFAALEMQSEDAPHFDVVVVADGCTDGTAALCREYQGRFAVTLQETEGRGPAFARNVGALAAKGELLLFLDDDVMPEPGLLAAHARCHAKDRGVVVMGPYPPYPHPGRDIFRQQIRLSWRTHFARVAQPGHRFGYRDVLTGNLSMRRALWMQLGGLDTDFAFAREDHELGCRLIAAGAEIRYCPQAFAWHHEHQTSNLKRAFRRAREEGHSDALIAVKHPGLRNALPISRTAMIPRSRWKRIMLLGRKGERIAALAMLGIPLIRWAEILGMRRVYDRMFNALHSLAYHRGACAALGGHWWKIFPQDQPTDEAVVLDMSKGITATEDELDRLRPNHAILTNGETRLGVLGYSAGHEPWAGRHLRAELLRQVPPAKLLAAIAPETQTSSGARISGPLEPQYYGSRDYVAFTWENASQWARAQTGMT